MHVLVGFHAGEYRRGEEPHKLPQKVHVFRRSEFSLPGRITHLMPSLVIQKAVDKLDFRLSAFKHLLSREFQDSLHKRMLVVWCHIAPQSGLSNCRNKCLCPVSHPNSDSAVILPQRGCHSSDGNLLRCAQANPLPPRTAITEISNPEASGGMPQNRPGAPLWPCPWGRGMSHSHRRSGGRRRARKPTDCQTPKIAGRGLDLLSGLARIQASKVSRPTWGRRDNYRFFPMLTCSIRQSPVGPSGVVTSTARSIVRVDRTNGALSFLGHPLAGKGVSHVNVVPS